MFKISQKTSKPRGYLETNKARWPGTDCKVGRRLEVQAGGTQGPCISYKREERPHNGCNRKNDIPGFLFWKEMFFDYHVGH